jgi:hypothetical protein
MVVGLCTTVSAGVSPLTYLGGTRLDAITGIAVDAAGYIYVAGWTESSDLRVVNAWQSSLAGSVDAFVAKLTPGGTSIVYCTYLGGSGDDRAFGIAADASGNAYVTGWTTSADFPQVRGLRLTFGGGKDVFIAKLDPSGTVVFSSFYGGSGQDCGNAIAVDSAGHIFVAGETDSANLSLKDAILSSLAGASDAFLLELDSNDLIQFATYLGGRYSDRALAVAVDGNGAVYLTGATASPNFPRANSFQLTLAGAQNAFITKIDSRTKQIVFSGFLGGSGGNGIASSDMGTAIAVDAAGAVYIAGDTNSTDFPVLNCFQRFASAFGDAFIAKIDPSGSALLYSTYLGGSSADYATAIAVDAAGRAWVAGYTLSLDFPRDASDVSKYRGQLDVFLTSLSPDGKSLYSSTLFGSSGTDAAFAMAMNGADIYIAGQTGSNDLNPSGGIQNTFSGLSDGFVAHTSNVGSGLRFVPVAPCRVADTRNPDGPFGGPMLWPPAIGLDYSRDFVVPNSACGIPVNAQAYALNVTVVPQAVQGLAFLTVWPAGLPRPRASTINSTDGRVKAVSAIVAAGAGSAIRIFVTDPTHLILDITGYFVSAADPAGLTFYPLSPCRIADTRAATGPLGGPSLAATTTRDIPVLSSPCSIPPAAVAYSLNLAVVPSSKLGYLTAWPSGQPRPRVSALNAPTGTPTANASILPAGAGGSISVYVTDNTDLIIDISGYFAPAASGGLSLYTFGPCRVLETRPPTGTGPFAGAIDVNFPASSCAVPQANAYLVNATVIPPARFGYLTLWPSATPQPYVSTLNAWDGTITSNMAIVPASNGSISAYARDTTNLLIDVFGYFAP